MEWQSAKLLLEKRARHDESGLEPGSLYGCVYVCVDGWGGWAGLDCCSGVCVTQCLTNTAALVGPPAARTVLLYWLISLSVCMCRHTCVCMVWFPFTLCTQYGPCVCVMGVSTFPGNPEADWVYMSRNLPCQTAPTRCTDRYNQTVLLEMCLADCYNYFNKFTPPPPTTDWRDAPECVWLHPHRWPPGVQTPAALGHVSSTKPGDISTPGQPATRRHWWVLDIQLDKDHSTQTNSCSHLPC